MKTRIINLTLLALLFAITALAISVMPDVVGVHFDAQGNPDRFGSKYELLIVPTVMLFMQAAMEFACACFRRAAINSDDDKKRAALDANLKQMNAVSVIASFVLLIVGGLGLYASYCSVDASSQQSFDIVKVVIILLGLMLIILGDRMPKTRTNSLIGFRLPWTMYNDLTWRKSNLFASYAMMLAGIISAVCALILEGTVAIIVFLALIVLATLISICYAYSVYKEEKSNEN